MTPRLLRSQRGFTMTEVIVVMAVMGILALFGSKLMVQVQKYFSINRARLITQQQGRSILSLMAKDLRQARSPSITITNPDIPPPPAVGGQGQPPLSRITFTRVGDPGLPDEEVTYYQYGSSLYRKAGSAPPTELTKNLRFLAFSFPRADFRELVNVSFSLERSTFQGKSKALHMTSENIGVMNKCPSDDPC